MNKKTIFTILAILITPIIIFWGITTTNKPISNEAIASFEKPQIIKFSSTMCLECQQVEKTFQEILPKYKDKIDYTSIIVDSRSDMENDLIKKYNVKLVPTIIMLNSDGTQKRRIESAIPKKEIEKYIEELK